MTRRWRRLQQRLSEWLDCRLKRCSYYSHYQAYGPCELTHLGWHFAEREGLRHFQNCDRMERTGVCPVCTHWEQRLRA
jgi:hypothetical protein